MKSKSWMPKNLHEKWLMNIPNGRAIELREKIKLVTLSNDIMLINHEDCEQCWKSY